MKKLSQFLKEDVIGARPRKLPFKGKKANIVTPPSPSAGERYTNAPVESINELTKEYIHKYLAKAKEDEENEFNAMAGITPIGKRIKAIFGRKLPTDKRRKTPLTIMFHRQKGIKAAAAKLAGLSEAKLEVGHKVHLGFGSKGGAGYLGKVIKIEGETVHVQSFNKDKFGHKVWKGPLKHITQIYQEDFVDEGRIGDIAKKAGKTAMAGAIASTIHHPAAILKQAHNFHTGTEISHAETAPRIAALGASILKHGAVTGALADLAEPDEANKHEDEIGRQKKFKSFYGKQNLNKSIYNSKFTAKSPEKFSGVGEEQIYEISKRRLDWYIDKTSKDEVRQLSRFKRSKGKNETASRKIANHSTGIDTAIKKLKGLRGVKIHANENLQELSHELGENYQKNPVAKAGGGAEHVLQKADSLQDKKLTHNPTKDEHMDEPLLRTAENVKKLNTHYTRFFGANRLIQKPKSTGLKVTPPPKAIGNNKNAGKSAGGTPPMMNQQPPLGAPPVGGGMKPPGMGSKPMGGGGFGQAKPVSPMGASQPMGKTQSMGSKRPKPSKIFSKEELDYFDNVINELDSPTLTSYIKKGFKRVKGIQRKVEDEKREPDEDESRKVVNYIKGSSQAHGTISDRKPREKRYTTSYSIPSFRRPKEKPVKEPRPKAEKHRPSLLQSVARRINRL